MEGVKMILQMVIGAGIALWSVIGLALIGWMIHAFIKDRDKFWSVVMLAIAWLCVTASVTWAMME